MTRSKGRFEARRARAVRRVFAALVALAMVVTLAPPGLSSATVEPGRSLSWATRHHAGFDPVAVPGNGVPILARDALVALADGSVYTTGMVSDGADDDILTLRYRPDGTLDWWRRYDNGSNDWGLSTAVLPDGGVAVFGSSRNSADTDLVTIVYGPDGTERWVARYDGGVEYPAGIEVGPDGDVVVAGRSRATGATEDIVVARYGPDGQERWVTRYDSGEHDYAHDLALSPDGGAVVTGYFTDGRWGDYLTVALDASGTQRWVDLYDNAGKADRAFGVAVDGAGNAYVTGDSDNGKNNDAVTVAYGPGGERRWVAAYDGGFPDSGFGIATAPGGGVVVGGQTYKGTLAQRDFLALSYEATGTVRWSRFYDAGEAHPGFGDLGHTIEVDTEGNVYVAGPSANNKTWYQQDPYDAAVASWDADGGERWVVRYNGGEWDRIESIDVDDAGNVYLAAETLIGASADMRTVKYGPDGLHLWASKEPALLPGGDDVPGSGDVVLGNDALAVDDHGNAYVVGRASTDAGDAMQLVKHDEHGVEEWTAMYDGGLEDRAYAAAVDGSGNTYVVGDIFVDATPEPHWDFMTLSFDPKGEMRWSSRFSEFFEDRVGALAVTPGGEVYVTGRTNNGSNFDIVTVKYGEDGTRLWEKTWDGNLDDAPVAVSVDDDGNAYVVGSAHGVHVTMGSGTSRAPAPQDVVTIKYSADGTEEWVQTYDGGLDDVAVDAVALPDGGVYVGANSPGKGIGDAVTLRYPADGGNPLTLNHDDGPNDAVADLALAPDGDVYTVSTALGQGLEEDFLVTRWGPQAGLRWGHRVERASRDHARAAVVDADGNLTITGVTESLGTTGPGTDYFSVTLDPGGTELWSATHDGGGADEAIAIAADPKGGVVVAGRSAGEGTDFVTVGYGNSVSASPSPSPTEPPPPEVTDVTFTEESATSGQYSDETLFEARLTDSNGDPIQDAELNFELTEAEPSRGFSATTDQDGVVAVTPTLEEKPGPYQLTARYDGDEEHAGDADTVSFVVEKEDSALELSVEGEDDDKTLRARLSDLDTSTEGIADRTIDFYSDGELIGSHQTDADGFASVALPRRHRGNNRTYEAVFEGDDFFLGSSDGRPGKGHKDEVGTGPQNQPGRSYRGGVLLL